MIIFAHTHESQIRKNGQIYVSPGECGGWLNGKSTIAILDTQTRGVEIIDLFTS
ncbi:MAG: hypothetical protein ACE5GU_03140 [Candidatus Scalinduaceae bacterium]